MNTFPSITKGSSFSGRPIEIKPRPKIMEELAEFLESKGHSCPMIIGTNNHKFEWCGKDICPRTIMENDMRQRQNQQEEHMDKLRSEGHTCITTMECYPVRIRWCEQNPCVNNAGSMNTQ
jgi:hypothetical protein